jgi:PAS domain S-box-containing protein
LRDFATGIAIALAYTLAALAALRLAADENNTAFIWPSAGIAVAALFRSGIRYWPAVLIGSLICELTLDPWWVAAAIAAGNTLGPVLTVHLLRWFQYDHSGAERRTVVPLLLAALLGMFVPAVNAALWRSPSGEATTGLLLTGAIGWLGNLAGVVIFAPPLLAAVSPRSDRGAIRQLASLGLTAAFSVLAFSDLAAEQLRALLLFPPFIMFVWVGMSERLRTASLHVLVFVGCAVVGTAAGRGAFGHLTDLEKLATLWVVATTAALIVLSLTSVLAEQKRAETALAASVSDYQALVDGTPAALVRYTSDGTITFVNESLCKVLGLSRSALIGQSVLDYIPDMPRADAVADLPVLPALAGPAAGSSGLIRKSDGSSRWYRWTARLITTASGTAEFQAVGIDLTERRQAESERAAIERKMQDAQRLEALGVLAGGVAHDFNNLLAGVLGHAELAVGLLPEGHAARDHLATVLSGVAQAGGLTRQLLAYSGKGRFLLRSLDLNDLIKQTTELLRITLPKKVQLTLDLAEGLPPVIADDGQLRQVLMNLIINAGEAIGDRAGTVTVTTTANEIQMDAVSGGVYSPTAPGRFIELVVADNGCGMDEGTRGKLFDPFFTTKFAGRGLGLSAVLGIVRGHGGGVRVDSRPGLGTRFTVLLPATSPSPPPAVNVVTPVPAGMLLPDASKGACGKRGASCPGSDPEKGARGLALVADDEPTVRQVGELMLQQLGFEVLTATNGQEVVALFEQHAERVCLVLLDLMMPVMDGTEAFAAIRARSTVPVILCSGYTAEAVPEELAGDSVTGFLQKPFARAELQRAVAVVGV